MSCCAVWLCSKSVPVQCLKYDRNVKKEFFQGGRRYYGCATDSQPGRCIVWTANYLTSVVRQKHVHNINVFGFLPHWCKKTLLKLFLVTKMSEGLLLLKVTLKILSLNRFLFKFNPKSETQILIKHGRIYFKGLLLLILIFRAYS